MSLLRDVIWELQLPDAMDPGIHGARTHLVFRSYAAAACQAARTAVICSGSG
jgi:hypothetical protein